MYHTMGPKLLALRDKTGYPIVQEHGQRKTGPPPFWIGPPPPKGCEVFIGKIPRDVFEDELFPLFQTPGVIYQFRLMMDFSCSNRGFAFVNYTNKLDAQNAIKLLNGYEIRTGRRIGVLKSVDNCKLYIGNIPISKSREEIYAEITKYTSGVRDVIVYKCDVYKALNRGFCFVEYETHFAASMARKTLIPESVKLFGCEITVDWASPQRDDDGETNSKPVMILHVSNIPFHISEGYLLNLFSLQSNLPVRKIQKIKDFAFIHYFARQDAETALNRLNGLNLSGSEIKVTWAKSAENQDILEKLDRCTLFDYAECFRARTQQNTRESFHCNPMKILSMICEENGWGEPVFHVIHSTSNTDEDETTFMAKVYIPNFPHHVKHFIPSEVYFSIKEAKICAAAYTLRTIPFLKTHQKAYLPCAGGLTESYIPKHSNYSLEMDLTNSSSSVCTLFKDAVVPESNEIPNQDNFYGVLASAASLANLQLQSEKKMDSAFEFLN